MDKERDKCLECGLVIRAKERNRAEKAWRGIGGFTGWPAGASLTRGQPSKDLGKMRLL